MLQRLQVENDALKSKVCVQAWQEGGCLVLGLIDVAISACLATPSVEWRWLQGFV